MGFASYKLRLALQISCVCALASAGIGVCASLIVDEIHGKAGPGHGPVLATIVEKENDVQRKAAGSYRWSNVDEADGFYNRESLQTGSESMARLEISSSLGGGAIEIGEQSLVVFDVTNEKLFRVLQGSAILKQRTIEKSIAATPAGDEVMSVFTSGLLSPAMKSEQFVKKGTKRPVTFKWSTSPATNLAIPSTTKLTLQISNDTTFSAPLVLSVSDMQVGQEQTKLGSGNYFWKLMQGSNPISRTWSFKITEASPLNLASITPVAPDAAQFQWEKIKSPGKHTIQISMTSDFKEILTDAQINPNDGAEQLNGLAPGSYFGRIESQFGDLKLESSAVAFTITQNLAENSASQTGSKRGLAGEASKASEVRRDVASAAGNTDTPTQLADNTDHNRSSDSSASAAQAVLDHNADPTLMPLNSTPTAAGLVLQWTNANATPDFWQLWCVGADGSPLSQLQTTVPSTANIPGTWSTASITTTALGSCGYLMVQSLDGSIESTVVQYLPTTATPQPPQIKSVVAQLLFEFVCAGNTACVGPVINSAPIRNSLNGPAIPLKKDTITYGTTSANAPLLLLSSNGYGIVNPEVMRFSNGQPIVLPHPDQIDIAWTSPQALQTYNITIKQGANVVMTYNSSAATNTASIGVLLSGNFTTPSAAAGFAVPYPEPAYTDPNFTVELVAVNGTGASAVTSQPAVYHLCLNNGLLPSAFSQAIAAFSPTKFLVATWIMGPLLVAPGAPLDINDDGYVDIEDVLNAARFTGTCSGSDP